MLHYCIILLDLYTCEVLLIDIPDVKHAWCSCSYAVLSEWPNGLIFLIFHVYLIKSVTIWSIDPKIYINILSY